MKHILPSLFFAFVAFSTNAQILSTDFESWDDEHEYVESSLDADGLNPRWVEGFDDSRCFIDDAFSKSGSKSLRVKYPSGGYGTSQTGAQAPMTFSPQEEVYASYYLRFSDDFDWGGSSEGGKLPGLGSGNNCSGGSSCDGTNGFSGRLMWRAGGRAVLYLYHMDKPATYGEDIQLKNTDGSDVVFAKGEWYQVAERVKINTGNNYDGEIDVWINGELALSLTGLRLVNNGDKVDNFYFSTFHGGSNSNWAPGNDSYVWYDDIKVGLNEKEVVQQKCQSPDLGPDLSLCGLAEVELNANITDNVDDFDFTWYYEGTEIPFEKANTYSTIYPGTYKVVSDSSGCTQEDEIEVLDVLPALSLGDDISLCSPSIYTIHPNISEASYDYSWTKDGVALSNDQAELTVYSAGEYTLTVTASSCASVTDAITIGSDLLTVDTDTLCTSGDAFVEVMASGDFLWFDALENGNQLGDMASLTHNVDQTTVIYVEDANGFSGTIGKDAPNFNDSKAWTDNRFDRKLAFTVDKKLTINSIDIYSYEATEVTVSIQKASNADEVHTKSFSNVTTGKVKTTLDLGFELDPGNYLISFEGTNGKLYYSNGNDTDISYPYVLDGFVTITGANYEWITNTPYFLFAYNWQISSGNACERTPVEIVVDPLGANCIITSNNLFDINGIGNAPFPNPTSGIVYLKESEDIEVFDMHGFRLLEAKEATQVDLSQYPKGTYIIKTEVESYKVVKQ